MLKNFADYFGHEALNARKFFDTDWPGAKWSRGGPVGIAGPGLLLAHGSALRDAGRADPLGRHRDLELLERLHGRRRALREAGRRAR